MQGTSAPWRIAVILAAIAIAILSFPAAGPGGESSPQFPQAIDPLVWGASLSIRATLESFGKGAEQYSKGRFEPALAAMPADSDAAYTAIADHILLWKSRIHVKLGHDRDALDLLRTLQTRHPDSPLLREALLDECRVLMNLDDSAGALAVLEKAGPAEGWEALQLRGQVLEAAGRRDEAIRVYLQIYADHVDADQSALAEPRLRFLSPDFQNIPENRELLLQRSKNLIRAGRNQEARTLLLKLASGKPPKSFAERVYLHLADAGTNLGRLSEALRYSRRVTETTLEAQALYLQGICFRGLKNEAAFLETRDRALKQYPRSPYTEKLLYSVATYFELQNLNAPVRAAYQALALAFPKGTYCQRALWKVAFSSYAERRYDAALGEFLQYLDADPTPDGAAASAYWMGRCCLELEEPAKARFLFERAKAIANISYYGQRAQEALAATTSPASAATGTVAGINFADVQKKLEVIRPRLISIPQSVGSASRMLERARQLMAAGLEELALEELGRAVRLHPGNEVALHYAMSRIHQSRQDFFGAISTLRRAFPDYTFQPPNALPTEVWDILFPQQYLKPIAQNAARFGLDTNLVLSVIRQESAFQQNARSRADARGLMQVLPSTGRSLARQAGMSSYSVSRLYNPETNIALGTRFLSALLKQYGGRTELALAAYNAGNTRVSRWMKEFGDVDMAEFVERIPLTETRGYVKQVLTNQAHYQIRTVPASGPNHGMK